MSYGAAAAPIRRSAAMIRQLSNVFGAMSRWVSNATGRPAAFALATLVVVAWAVSGPIFGFSDTWQLVINTGTTIVTFLMVFLIQHTQNRDNEALHLKIDELIRAAKHANNAILDLEQLEDVQLDRIRRIYARLAQRARAGKQVGKEGTQIIETQIGTLDGRESSRAAAALPDEA